MASGLSLGSNLLSQRKLGRDSFLASKKLQECVVLWWAFFSLPLHQHNFKSIIPNNIMLWNLDVGCGKTIFRIRAYPRWGHFSVRLLYRDVLLTELNPFTDARRLFSSLHFGRWNFFTKGLMTWSEHDLFSHYVVSLSIRSWPSGPASASVRHPCSLRVRWTGCGPAHSGYGICRNVPWAAAAGILALVVKGQSWRVG